MRALFHITLVSLLIFFAPEQVSAQSLPPAQSEGTLVMVDGRVVGTIVLDTLQRTRLEQVEMKYEKDRAALMEWRDAFPREKMQSRQRELSEQRIAGIKAVLTAGQFQQWQRLTSLSDTSDK